MGGEAARLNRTGHQEGTAHMDVDTAFSGKTALVTGAASGIGAEIARQLGQHGAKVLATDVTEDAIRDVTAEITGRGGRAEAMVVDVTDRARLAEAIDTVVDRYGKLDYVFNNAGVAIFGEFDEVTLDDWDKIIDVNLRGVAHGSALAYRRMVQQGSGHIVNTASVAGLVPVPLQAHYCATKHAIVGMDKTLRLEAAEHGVRVTTFCPAFVQSGMFVNNTFRGSLKGIDARAIVPIAPLSTDRAVSTLLAGVARGRERVIVPFYGRIGWWFERVSPWLSGRFHRVSLRLMRARATRTTAKR